MAHTGLLGLFGFSGFILLQKDNLKQQWQDRCAQYALSGVYQMTAVTVIFI